MYHKNRKAMTLVEVLMATLVFLIAVPSILQGLIGIMAVADNAKDRNIATTDLQSMLESIKAVPFDDVVTRFPDNIANGPVSNPYSNITGNYTLDNEQITVRYANPGSDPLEINTTVSWRDKRGGGRNALMHTFRTR